jgi:CBS domain containing-hemolysin-like protein
VDENLSLFEEVKGESESLGGLILEINKTLPKANEEVTFMKYTFIPIAVDKRRIKKVKVKINVSTKDAEDSK